jgi:hypothetical protein
MRKSYRIFVAVSLPLFASCATLLELNQQINVDKVLIFAKVRFPKATISAATADRE